MEDPFVENPSLNTVLLSVKGAKNNRFGWSKRGEAGRRCVDGNSRGARFWISYDEKNA
jgi:hypothetical protein